MNDQNIKQLTSYKQMSQLTDLYSNSKYIYTLKECDKWLLITQLQLDFDIYREISKDNDERIYFHKDNGNCVYVVFEWKALWGSHPTFSNLRHLCIKIFGVSEEEYEKSKTNELCHKLHKLCYSPMGDIHELALKTLEKLNRTPDENGLYCSMQISIGLNSRIYIWLSSAMENQYIVHEEYDKNRKLDVTSIRKGEFMRSYITSFDTITFIGINKPDKEIQVIYKDE